LLLAACSEPSGNTAGTGGGSSGVGGGGGGAGGASGGAGGIGGAGAGGGASGIGGVGGGGGAVAGSGGMSALDASTLDASGGSDAPVDASKAGDVTPERGLIVPTAEWSCDQPLGIAAPDTGEKVLEVELELGETLEVGATPLGMRRIFPASGGAVSGDVTGEVITGGLDWELTLPSGALEIETRHVLRASDGTLIYVRGCGIGAGDGARLVVTLEVAGGAHAALQDGLYIATRVIEGSVGRFSVYRVPAPTADAVPAHTIVRSAADSALQPNTWNCSGPPAGTSEGTQIMTATVGIGGSLAVGATQNGSRNIIPITGGDFEGMASAASVNGEVIPGGADFQLTPSGGSFEIEARYTLRAQDGSLIAVRNCGGFGGTQLMFETATASPHAFLNEQSYFGRISVSIGAVIISVYEPQ
jgi:hypothetical protein